MYEIYQPFIGFNYYLLVKDDLGLNDLYCVIIKGLLKFQKNRFKQINRIKKIFDLVETEI